jgi:Undecaprenyl-phosphate galactose phosphotransferase WbaP
LPDVQGVPLLTLDEVKAWAQVPGVQVVVALEHGQNAAREKWLRRLARWKVEDISVIPAMRGVPLYGTDISYFFSHEVAMLKLSNNLRYWPARLLKRVFDLLAALALLALGWPLLLYLSWRIRQDGGPAIFAHKRVGQSGKVFACYKFRSMRVDAEEQLRELLASDPALRVEWEKEFKLKDDPRISEIGHFLRRTSLDELPQLFNVIKGEMSLVGPRPVVRKELERYGDDVDYFLMVRPGMTGLWQVSGRNDVNYDTRVYLDTWYVKNWSLWYDIAILFKTIRVVLKRDGAY